MMENKDMTKYFEDIKRDGPYMVHFSDYKEAVVFHAACFNEQKECVEGTGTVTCFVSSIHGQNQSLTDENTNVILLSEAGPEAKYKKPTFLGGFISANILVEGLEDGLTLRVLAWSK